MNLLSLVGMRRSAKNNQNIRASKLRLLSIIWKSVLSDKIKRDFFQAVAVSILPYRCTTWTLTKRIEKTLDRNYTRMLRAKNRDVQILFEEIRKEILQIELCHAVRFSVSRCTHLDVITHLYVGADVSK